MRDKNWLGVIPIAELLYRRFMLVEATLSIHIAAEEFAACLCIDKMRLPGTVVQHRLLMVATAMHQWMGD